MTACVIIGAGPGLGMALATRFGREGARIGLVARNGAALRAQSERLTALSVRHEIAIANAGDAVSLQTAISDLEEAHGPTGVLIYNAAIMKPAGPFDLTLGRLVNELQVNVVGALASVQSVAPAMKRAGRGTILFTGGGLALDPYPQWTSLGMGKAALRSLTFSLHKELSPHNIRTAMVQICGLVEPGSPFDPDRIAEVYWRLHTGEERDTEVIYRPVGADADYNAPKVVD